MSMPNYNTLEEYFQNCTPGQIAEYDRIKQIVLELAPEAEETLSYGIPTFKYKKKPLLHWGAFRDHLSLYPTADPIAELKDKVKKYTTGKGTLQYQESDPIPKDLIQDLVMIRLNIING